MTCFAESNQAKATVVLLHVVVCLWRTGSRLPVTVIVAMPRLPSPLPRSVPLSNIFLPEIDEFPSPLRVQPTTYSEGNNFSAIDDMNTTLFRPRRVVSPAESEGTIFTSPTERERRDEPHEFPHFREVTPNDGHHNDSESSDEFFHDTVIVSAKTTQNHPAKTKRTSSFTQSASPTSTRAKRPRNSRGHKQRTPPGSGSSPASERRRAKHPRLQDIENGSPETATLEETKYESIEKASKKGQMLSGGRNLRRRTIQQTHPYQFEKIQYNLEKATGVAALSEDVEDAIQEVIDSSPKAKPKPRRKGKQLTGGHKAGNAKTKKGKNVEPRRGRSGSMLSETSSVALPDILERTTLQIWLDGFSCAAAPVSLSKVKDVDQLMDRMIDNWEWKFEGKVFSHAIASFPWLSKESNILIRPGMTDSFLKLMREVMVAPVWAEQAGDQEKSCDVKVVMFLQA